MPHIRFLRLANGANIAYVSMGHGPPLVFAPTSVTHLGASLDLPALRTQLESLAQSFTVIMYDRWGNGLSDRARQDWSLDAEVAVLNELVESLGLDPFTLVGISGGGPLSVLYASRYPTRLSHLVLYGTFANRSDVERAGLESLLGFVASNWGLAAGAVAQVFVPDLDSDHLKWFLTLQREGAGGEAAERVSRMEMLADVTTEAQQLAVPTLVIHRRDDLACPFAKGRELAGYIPSARFVPLSGDQHYWFRGDAGEITSVIKDFIRPPESQPADETRNHPFRTILFTDVEDHTSMMSRLGDSRGREVLREHERLTRAALAAHGEVKSRRWATGSSRASVLGSARWSALWHFSRPSANARASL